MVSQNATAQAVRWAAPVSYTHLFGNFEVLYNGTPLVFEREKAKELLALLDVYKRQPLTHGIFG